VKKSRLGESATVLGGESANAFIKFIIEEGVEVVGGGAEDGWEESKQVGSEEGSIEGRGRVEGERSVMWMVPLSEVDGESFVAMESRGEW
jgi:hypothetical protein